MSSSLLEKGVVVGVVGEENGDGDGDGDGDDGRSEPAKSKSLSLSKSTSLSSAFERIPKNEIEAKETFRQNAIDIAHSTSAISWPEHVDNFLFHHTNSLVYNDVSLSGASLSLSGGGASSLSRRSSSFLRNNNNNSNHVTGISTLRKRRNNNNNNNSTSTNSRSGAKSSGIGDGGGMLSTSDDDGSGGRSSTFSAMKNKSSSIRSSIMVSQEGGIQDDDSKNYDDEEDDDIEMMVATTTTTTPNPNKGGNQQEDDDDGGGGGGVEGTETINISTTATATATATTKNTTKLKPKKVPVWEKYYNRHIQLLVSLALFSYLGEYIRYGTEYFFGGACHHPNTTYWDASGLNICTTDYGTGPGTGGGFFIDLPTNVIGCFIMGLLVSGDGESIAINLPIAALTRTSKFQYWIVTHVGLRTGLCGSLTTFASWNTQMVIMICGRSGTELGYSQWMSSIWGYIIGLYAALQSYQFGVAIAYALSRKFNHDLAIEADIIVDKKSIGVLINRDLPDFERRFLHSIVLNEDEAAAEAEQVREEEESQHTEEQVERKENLHKYGDTHESYYDNHIHHLRAWKHSTNEHRGGKKRENTTTTTNTTTNTENYVQDLQEIEKYLLVDCIEPRQELLDIARDAGWDVGALRNWTNQLDNEEKKRIINESGGGGGGAADTGLDEKIVDAYYSSSSGKSTSPLWEVGFNLILFLLCTALLLFGFMHFKGKTDSVSTNARGQFLSALLSPFGTYSRWYLSRLNGSIKTKNWEWLPIGTFLANMIASIISALCAAITLKVPDDQYLAHTFLDAIKTGYAGSFSTVSTFVAEITGLSRALPRYFWSYYYGFGSLFIALILGVCSYVWAVV